MGLIYSDDKHYMDIADALREKLGTQDTYLPSEMAHAVSEIESSEDTLKALFDTTGNAGGIFYTVSNIPTLQYDTTSKVKCFGGMYDRTSITEIPHINTAKGTEFGLMFRECNGLRTASIGIANEFSLAHAETLHGMFAGCENLIDASVTNIPESCKYLSSLFAECYALEHVIVSGDTSNVEDVSGMFYGISAETVSLFDTSSVKKMDAMLAHTPIIIVPAYDCTNVISFSNMLDYCCFIRRIEMLNIGASIDISYSNLYDLDALRTIITNLKTIPQGETSPVLTMKSASYALLTPEYIAMASQKNWTINTP